MPFVAFYRAAGKTAGGNWGKIRNPKSEIRMNSASRFLPLRANPFGFLISNFEFHAVPRIARFLLEKAVMRISAEFRSHAIAVLLVAAAVTSACGQAPLPPLTPAEGLGVNIHTTWPGPGELEMIKAAGFHWIRMDLTWSATEKQKGRYDFSAYDRLLGMLEKQNIRALFVLDYGNPLYADPGDKQPFTSRAGTEEFRQGYAAWAAAAVAHFAGRGCVWEIWNEPNYKNFWAPAPNVSQYVALAAEADAAIRQAAPGEPIIGPASSTMDFDFIERCCQAGLLRDWAAVSVHPYRRTDPQTAAEDFRKLRALIAKYAPADRPVPIVCSEWGYSTSWTDFNEVKQADYLKREFATNIASGIPLSIWYDWRDDGDTPEDPEHRFGLVHRQYHPGRDPVYDAKPAYGAMKAYAGEMGKADAPSVSSPDGH